MLAPNYVIAALVAGFMSISGIAAAESPVNVKPRNLIIQVAPYKVECVGVGPMECLQFRHQNSSTWENYSGTIQGFNFREGTLYTLAIAEYPSTAPYADGSSIRWVLKKVIKRTPVATGNRPQN